MLSALHAGMPHHNGRGHWHATSRLCIYWLHLSHDWLRNYRLYRLYRLHLLRMSTTST